MSGNLKSRRVLVVDDELAIRKALQERLQEAGAQAFVAADVSAARALLAQNGGFDLVLLDHRLPDGTGLALLEEMKGKAGAAPLPAEVVMMTAYSSTQDAVRAMKAGAADYVMKPFDLDEMLLVAERALENRRLRSEVARLRTRERRAYGPEHLVGRSRHMAELRDLIGRVAGSIARTILVTGESGTGKDLVARAIHDASPEADRPFLNVTCTALPETLLESELFGHERGAFTDARAAKEGLFEQAHGGTIFLDEIGDMPLSLQAKLLRFLESRQFRRLGGLRDIEVEVRIIAATNRDLPSAIADGQFRSDLYYRLNVIPIELSPLRRHAEDVPDLVGHFVRHFAKEFRKEITGFDADAMDLLNGHGWPGNVRELKNRVERAVLLGRGPLLGVGDLGFVPREHAPPAADPGAAASPDGAAPQRILTLPEKGVVLDDLVKDLLDQALERCGGNKSRAATLLGIHRDQVRYWVKKYRLLRWVRTADASRKIAR